MTNRQDDMTIAISIKVPEQLGWSVRAGVDSWAGQDISGLLTRLAELGRFPTTIAVSLVVGIGEGGK